MMNRFNYSDNRGSTMVEGLVGFTILVIVLVECMVHIVGVSSEMVEKSIDMKNDQLTLNEELYQKDTASAFEDIDGITISLSIDEDRTNVRANQANTDTKINLNAKLKKYQSEATEITVFKFFYDGE